MRKFALLALLLIAGAASLIIGISLVYHDAIASWLHDAKDAIIVFSVILGKRAAQRPGWKYVTIFFTALLLGYRRRGILRRWITRPMMKVYSAWASLHIFLRTLLAAFVVLANVALFWATQHVHFALLLAFGLILERMYLMIFETLLYRYTDPIRRWWRHLWHRYVYIYPMPRKARHYIAMAIQWAETNRSRLIGEIRRHFLGTSFYFAVAGTAGRKAKEIIEIARAKHALH